MCVLLLHISGNFLPVEIPDGFLGREHYFDWSLNLNKEATSVLFMERLQKKFEFRFFFLLFHLIFISQISLPLYLFSFKIVK